MLIRIQNKQQKGYDTETNVQCLAFDMAHSDGL